MDAERIRQLPNELQRLILGYVRYAFTNESLRAAVREFIRDRATCERRHGKIGTWDVGRVTSMSQLFFCPSNPGGAHFNLFNEDIGAWDTSSVTTMWRTFYGCENFEGRGIGAWDTSSVTDMSYMFSRCRAFNENIGAWDASNVVSMSQMFDSAHAFNQDISAWNVSSVRHMNWMFMYCSRFNQNLRSSWDTSKALPVPTTNFLGADRFCEANRPLVRYPDYSDY